MVALRILLCVLSSWPIVMISFASFSCQRSLPESAALFAIQHRFFAPSALPAVPGAGAISAAVLTRARPPKMIFLCSKADFRQFRHIVSLSPFVAGNEDIVYASAQKPNAGCASRVLQWRLQLASCSKLTRRHNSRLSRIYIQN